MSIRDVWSTAFPIRPIEEAAKALHKSWCALSGRRQPGFNRRTHEPKLTRVLKEHVARVTGPEHGLLGMWAAEAVYNEVDPDTAEIRKENRTDIVYGWNNDRVGIEFVFEFKKLSRYARSRNKYLGEDGLRRFVDGAYARGQPMAAMVGILVDSRERILPALEREIAKEPRVKELRIRCRSKGAVLQKPSQLFPSIADFDTEHERRDELLAEGHDTIRVVHLFFEFGQEP